MSAVRRRIGFERATNATLRGRGRGLTLEVSCKLQLAAICQLDRLVGRIAVSEGTDRQGATSGEPARLRRDGVLKPAARRHDAEAMSRPERGRVFGRSRFEANRHVDAVSSLRGKRTMVFHHPAVTGLTN